MRHTASLTALAGIAARVGVRLLPWTSVLVLSGSIAYALEAVVAQTLDEPSAIVKATASESDDGCDARSRPLRVDKSQRNPPLFKAKDCRMASAEPGAHWLTLGGVESEGSVMSVMCLAGPDRAVDAVLYVPAEDMDAVVAKVCLRTWL